MPGTDRRIDTPRLTLDPVPLGAAYALLRGQPVRGLRAAPGWPQADTLAGLGLDVALGDPARTGWFIRLRTDGAVIGDCGWRGGPDPNGEAELGYGLAAPFRGQGYGAEAVGGLAGWCAAQPGVRRLVARVLPANVPSRRVLIRLGFVLDGPDGEYLRYYLPVH